MSQSSFSPQPVVSNELGTCQKRDITSDCVIEEKFMRCYNHVQNARIMKAAHSGMLVGEHLFHLHEPNDIPHFIIPLSVFIRHKLRFWDFNALAVFSKKTKTGATLSYWPCRTVAEAFALIPLTSVACGDNCSIWLVFTDVFSVFVHYFAWHSSATPKQFPFIFTLFWKGVKGT